MQDVNIGAIVKFNCRDSQFMGNGSTVGNLAFQMAYAPLVQRKRYDTWDQSLNKQLDSFNTSK